ncbi:hypothetical protein BKA70DRAFT_1434835 [Coprinopsis sp. MPI-PUGE-AT-0042]|nr:hypothetical protein BKA70DRAFT_1434835 [Coprinopsis sp. MPI-PUGE-AT-0042]
MAILADALKPHTMLALVTPIVKPPVDDTGSNASQLTEYARSREARSYIAKDKSRACLSVPIESDAEGCRFTVAGKVSLQVCRSNLFGLCHPELRHDRIVDSGQPQCFNGFVEATIYL